MRRWFWTALGSALTLTASGAGATTLLMQPAASTAAGGHGRAAIGGEAGATGPGGAATFGGSGSAEFDFEVVAGPSGATGSPAPERRSGDERRHDHGRVDAFLRWCAAHHDGIPEGATADGPSRRELLARCLAHHRPCDRLGAEGSATSEERPPWCHRDGSHDRPNDRPDRQPDDRPVGEPDDRPVGQPAEPPASELPAGDGGAHAGPQLGLEIDGSVQLDAGGSFRLG